MPTKVNGVSGFVLSHEQVLNGKMNDLNLICKFKLFNLIISKFKC